MWQTQNPESQSQYDEVNKYLEAKIVCLSGGMSHRSIASIGGSHGATPRIHIWCTGSTPCTTNDALYADSDCVCVTMPASPVQLPAAILRHC